MLLQKKIQAFLRIKQIDHNLLSLLDKNSQMDILGVDSYLLEGFYHNYILQDNLSIHFEQFDLDMLQVDTLFHNHLQQVNNIRYLNLSGYLHL